MAGSARGKGGRGNRTRSTSGRNGSTRPGGSGTPASRRTAKPASAGKTAAAPALPDGPLRVGAVPGATPGRWVDTWQRRHPGIRLELDLIDAAAVAGALADGTIDVAIARIAQLGDAAGLHVIALYDETPVVVCAADSHLTAADRLTTADLAGEVLIVPRDNVLDAVVPGTETPAFAPLDTTGDAIATVASGVGIVIVPHSLARMHARKDAAIRPLDDGPASRVGLAWPVDGGGALVEEFIGIVRGRTARSSR